MENIPQLVADETLPAVPPAMKTGQRANGWLRSALPAIPTPARLLPVAYSFADQALAVGGGFLVNVALARTQTKEEYGMFALSYSVYTLLLALYQAAILEPYTIYGSGRYRERFAEYLRLIVRTNVLAGLLLTAILLLTCFLLSLIAPQLMSRALWGLGLTAGVLLSAHLLRRTFYLQRKPELAAKTSLVFFITVACGLWLTTKAHRLDSFTVFLSLALGWIAAAAAFGRKLALGKPKQHFLQLESHYWREHWNYSKWVLATAFVFQFTTQAYYWLVAGFLSTKEVGELRATYLLVAPMDQVLIALGYLVIPALAAHYAANRIGSFLSLWKRYGLAAVGVASMFTLAVRITGKQAMHMLYAGKYDGLAPSLFVLALLPLLMAIGSTMSNAVIATERPKLVFFAYLGSGAVTFLGGIPLVMHFGLWGAVYGMLLSGAAYSGSLTLAFALHIHRHIAPSAPRVAA
jgi:O-antigen/teichoic acid export membrane protein